MLVLQGPRLEVTERNEPFDKAELPKVSLEARIDTKGSRLGLDEDQPVVRARIMLPKEIRWKWDWQVRLVDKQGKEVLANEWASSGATPNELAESFDIGKPDDVQKVVLLARSYERDYHWSEFHDVPLLPREPRLAAKPPLAAKDGAAEPLKSRRAADMRAVVLAALEYAAEHHQWPAKLDELKPNRRDAGKIELGQFVYHPVSEESLEENPQEEVVLAEKAPAFPGGQLVGFADGYVEFIRDPQRLKRLLGAEAEVPPASNANEEEAR